MTFYEVSVGGRNYKIEAERAPQAEGPQRATNQSDWKIRIDSREILVDCVPVGSQSLSLVVNGKSCEARIERSQDGVRVLIHGRAYECSVRDPRSLRSRKSAGQHQSGEQKVTASMPGKVVRVLARAGDSIVAGQGILVIEAMKMQNEVRAPRDGTVKNLIVREGAAVNAGEVLAILD